MITFRQHLSGLFIAGIYYSLSDDILGAKVCFETAVSLLQANILTDLFNESMKESINDWSSPRS